MVGVRAGLSQAMAWAATEMPKGEVCPDEAKTAGNGPDEAR